jgi:hypothetical protein
MHIYALPLLFALGSPCDPSGSLPADSMARQQALGIGSVPGVPSTASLPAGVRWCPRGEIADDTSIEYSDWYERRLTIHKWASYTTLPLFAFQYFAGRELYEKSSDAPSWAKTGHGIAATGVAALFTVNTVTGVWNMWDARKDPEGRKWRTAHAVLMLAADAGFTATGLLAEKAESSPDDRRLHRTVALSSVAVATASYLMMLPPLRRD